MQIVSSGIQHALADIGASTDLDNYAIDLATIFDQAAGSIVGSVAGDDIVDVVKHTRAGVHESGFSDIFYNRIWIIEKHTDLGNLVADQTREIELWNAHFESKTLTGYTVDGDIDVDGFASGEINALESKLYSVAIPIIGAPSLSASITWAFEDAELAEFVATIVGQRVIPFLLRHNWKSPVLEQIAFKTDVLPALSGKEQRIGLITEPRRRVEMEYLTLTPMERGYLENVLYGWQGRPYAVPFYPDLTRLTAEAPAGTTVFSLDTTTRDFEVGSLLFINNGINHDTLEITDITDDSITTRTGCLFDYTAGTKCTPARIGILDSSIDLSRLTSTIEEIRLAWRLATNQHSTNRRESYTPVTYRGIEVYDKSNDYSSDIGIKQSIAEEIGDNETGIIRKKSIGGQAPRRTYPFRDLLTRDELPKFIEWVYNRKGRLNPFWFNERVPSFFLQTSALSTDTNLIVKTGGYTQFAFPHASRRDIAIKTSAGWKYRRITGSVINNDGTETITIDSALGVALDAGINPMMSYLKFVRLDTDMVELSYQTTGAIQTSTAFTDLLIN